MRVSLRVKRGYEKLRIDLTDPFLALIVVVLCGLIAHQALLHPNDWTRRVGKFSLWAMQNSPYSKTFRPAFSEKLARRAVEEPETVIYYRVLWLVMGIMSLIFAACTLLVIFGYLARFAR